MKLRRYKKEDAKTVLSWINGERAFFLWCADRFTGYPIGVDEFNGIYSNCELNGMIAEDDGEAVGHFFVQRLSEKKYKLGLIVVDNTKRGKGYGKNMLKEALAYVRSEYGAEYVTLSVFESNVSAERCYTNLGFTKTGEFTEIEVLGQKEKYYKMEYIF